MDAFENAYERHQGAVRRFALFLTGDPARADDLVSEAFFGAWQARGRLEYGSVRAYLMTIVRNLYRDELRRQRLPPVPLDNIVLVDPARSTDTRLESAAALARVRAGLTPAMAFGMLLVPTANVTNSRRNPGVVIGTVFAVIAGATWFSARRSGRWAKTMIAGWDSAEGHKPRRPKPEA